MADVLAGVSVGVLLIPQSLAYSTLAGLPAVYGLYTSIIPLFVYGLLGSSTKLQLGPVGPTAILIASTLNSIVKDVVETDASGEEVPSQAYIDSAIGLCFVVGIIQCLLGLLRFGFIASMFLNP